MKHTTKDTLAEIHRRNLRLAQSVTLEKVPQEWIHIMPVGHWENWQRSGEPYDITAQMISEMVLNFELTNLDLLCDYEHESLWGITRASGWISEMQIRPNGLWGKVRWTPTVLKAISEEEYRYLSPAWEDHFHDPKTGENMGAKIHSVALTNTPFFEIDLEQVIAAKETVMDFLNKLIALLGLAEGATEEDVITAVTELKTKAEAAPTAAKKVEEADKLLSAVRNELKIPSTAKSDEYVAAIKARGEQATTLAQEVQTLKLQMATATAEKLVEQAMFEGKLTAAQRPWALEQATANAQSFKSFLATQPVLVPSKAARGKPHLEADDAPTEVEKATAAMMGVDPKLVAKRRLEREMAA